AEVFTRVLGRRIVYPNPSPLRFWRCMRARGHPADYVTVMLGLYTVARLGLAAHLSPEAERLLGRPPISLEQFVRDYADAWRFSIPGNGHLPQHDSYPSATPVGSTPRTCG
ncbi:MAG TPA: hypothetical protein VGW38_06335, partial [Chloroflexota bacterium]|nr:hypothetical protein [Chloroflexota bacterium]